MGEGLVAPTAAAAAIILDINEVQKHLLTTLSTIIPPTTSVNVVSEVSESDITLEGLEINNGTANTTNNTVNNGNNATSKATANADYTVQEYVSQVAAHLVVYDTLPTVPLNGVSEDAWRYALATTETGQWKGNIIITDIIEAYYLNYTI